MNTELLVLEESTALQVLSSGDEVDRLVDEVRVKVESFDGDMSTGVGRKAIISNANKARRTNAALGEVIDGLIETQKKSIEGVESTIKMLRDNKKRLKSGLTGVYEDARKTVTDFEDELNRIEQEKAAIEYQKTLDAAHELALMYDDRLNTERAAKQAEQARLDKEESDRLAEEQRLRDEQLQREAAERATREAEQKAKQLAIKQEKDRQQLIMDNAHGEALLINRDIDDKARAIKDAADKIAAQELAKRNAKIAAEKARQDEIDRREKKEAAELAEQKRLKANKEHKGRIHREILEDVQKFCTSEEQAKALVKMLVNNRIRHVGNVKY